MATPFTLAQTPLTNNLITQLAKFIDQQKKTKPYGEVFTKPVDYVALGLPDYPVIIQKPMDYNTLLKNLNNKSYTNLAQFIQDASLIFANCKKYNGDAEEGWYVSIADQAESGFITALSRIFADLNTDFYTQILSLGDIVTASQTVQNYTDEPKITDIQALVRKMSELDETKLGEVVAVYCNAKGIEMAQNGDVSYDLQLRVVDGELIWQMMRLCDQKIEEQKKSKKKGRK